MVSPQPENYWPLIAVMPQRASFHCRHGLGCVTHACRDITNCMHLHMAHSALDGLKKYMKLGEGMDLRM